MEKKLSNIPQDKLLHFFYGALISFALDFFIPKLYVILIVLVIALAKEVYDLTVKKTKIDFLDILFTILPSLF